MADLVDRLDGGWHVDTSSVFEEHHPIRVGFISRVEITDADEISAFAPGLAAVKVEDDGTTIHAMPRAARRVRVRIDGHDIDLVACHLKSKLLSFPGGFAPKDEGQRARYGGYALARRAAEAVTVSGAADALLDNRGTDRAVVVLGDLNDEPASGHHADHPRPAGRGA